MMEQITVVIVDDMPASIDALASDLERFPDIEVVETATSAEKARKVLVKQQPDLLFLDVEMPKQTGMELLQEIGPMMHASCSVVCYSAYDKYLIDALRAAAFDYLLKPYQPEELTAIIERVRREKQMGTANFEQSMRRLLANDRKFARQTVTGLLLLRKEEILYFQYNNEARCWQLLLTEGGVHKLRPSVRAQEILFISDSFLQVSQDIIVNADYLQSIENGTLRCTFCPPHDKVEVKASRRFYAKIRETLDII